MTKLVIEVSVLIIPDFDYAVFNPKGISEVDIKCMMMNFHEPVIDIPAVKQGLPFGLSRNLALGMAAGEADRNKNRDKENEAN